MVKIVKFLLIIIVIYSKPLISSTSFLYKVVNGSLADSWSMKYSIFAQDFKGVILYCVDSEFNTLRMELMSTVIHKVVRISYNGGSKEVQLISICGCDPCNNEVVYIEVQSHHNSFIVTCNDGSIETIIKVTGNQKNENIDDPLPMPKILTNTHQNISIRIGNVGPYLSKDGAKVAGWKNQMIGCVDAFFYNERRIVLLAEGDKVKLHCPKMCINNICNGGLCQKRTMEIVSCDCSKVALNGPYCNRSMKSYNPRAPNSYSISIHDSSINIKTTWKSSIKKHYCLMEIINKNQNVLISTNETSFIFDSLIIRKANHDWDFFNIYIKTTSLILTITNETFSKEFIQDGIMRINIGFSERNMSCEIFEGEYDIYTNSSLSTSPMVVPMKMPMIYEKHIVILGLIVTCGLLVGVIIIMSLRMRILIRNGVPRNIALRISANMVSMYQSISRSSRRSDSAYVDMSVGNANETHAYAIMRSRLDDGIDLPVPPRTF